MESWTGPAAQCAGPCPLYPCRLSQLRLTQAPPCGRTRGRGCSCRCLYDPRCRCVRQALMCCRHLTVTTTTPHAVSNRHHSCADLDRRIWQYIHRFKRTQHFVQRSITGCLRKLRTQSSQACAPKAHLEVDVLEHSGQAGPVAHDEAAHADAAFLRPLLRCWVVIKLWRRLWLCLHDKQQFQARLRKQAGTDE